MTANGPFVLGLTGSIGMGKTTTAGFFKEFGVPVWDADAAVHRLYSKGGPAVALVGNIVPDAIIEDRVDRVVLKEWIRSTPNGLQELENVVHPLVAEDRGAFLQECARIGDRIVVLDIPLLFETGGSSLCDATLVVTVSAEVQRARVMARNVMTEKDFELILSQQMPDAEKRKRADYVIETTSLYSARRDVKNLLITLERQVENHA